MNTLAQIDAQIAEVDAQIETLNAKRAALIDARDAAYAEVVRACDDDMPMNFGQLRAYLGFTPASLRNAICLGKFTPDESGYFSSAQVKAQRAQTRKRKHYAR